MLGRGVLTSSEADQRSPLLRSIDRPSAREGGKQPSGRKRVSCWLQGVEASIFAIMYGDMDGRGGASEAPGGWFKDYLGGKTFVLGRRNCYGAGYSVYGRLDTSNAAVSHETAKYSQTRQKRVGQSGCV